MGNSRSRQMIQERDQQIRQLQGRLHLIRQQNEEIDNLKQELETNKKRLSNHAVKQKEEELSRLKDKVRSLEQDLLNAQREVERYRSSASLSRSPQGSFSRSHSPSPRRGSWGFVGVVDKFGQSDFEKENASKKNARAHGGIAAAPLKLDHQDVMNTELATHPKNESVKDVIREAIHENDFLAHLEEDQIKEIIECMQPLSVEPNVSIIKEGDDGDKLYVIQSGEARVTKLKQGRDEYLRTMKERTLFGELAILYSTPRTASVTAATKCELWSLERLTFQIIMMKTGLLRTQDRLEMVKKVPRFAALSTQVLTQIVDAFEENQYEESKNIVLQGARGETFYIVVSGQILAKKEHTNGKQDRRFLVKGDYFGEKSLDGDEVRQETMQVVSPEGVTCLCMDRDTLKTVMENSGGNRQASVKHPTTIAREIPENLKRTRLGELCIIETLGVGGFGRVELVQVGEDTSKTYALKQIKKIHVVEMKQQDHILNERRILLKCKSDFIIKLYRTFRNNKFVYMLMDASMGGELWRLLRDRGPFNDHFTSFYTACTMEAVDYLHARGIVYRDLKPENLLVNDNGYVKLVDFGFAKEIGHGKKTWTFCGTPEYVAPEIILNKGHDFAVDLWSLGILMYELLTGNPPFSASDPMKTYNMILKGIDAIQFPRRVSKNAKDLIKKVCRESPSDRLGYSRAGIVEIQKHKWFDGFNWEGLRSHTLQPPIKPTVRNSMDTTNFDEYPEETDAVPEETSDWDKEFAETFDR